MILVYYNNHYIIMCNDLLYCLLTSPLLIKPPLGNSDHCIIDFLLYGGPDQAETELSSSRNNFHL